MQVELPHRVCSCTASEAAHYRLINVPSLGEIKLKDNMSEEDVGVLSRELLDSFKQGKIVYKGGGYESTQTEFSILAEYGHNVSYQCLLEMDLLGHGESRWIRCCLTNVISTKEN